jgi:hypothetical protein
MFAAMVETSKDRLSTIHNTYTALIQRIKGSQNPNALVHEIRDASDATDEIVKQFQAYRESLLTSLREAEAKVEEHIKANLMPTDGSVVDTEALTSEAKALRDEFNQIVSLVSTLVSDEDARNAFKDAVPTLEKLPRQAKEGSEASTGQLRLRLASITVRGTDPASDPVNVGSTCTNAAKAISASYGVDFAVTDLTHQIVAAAGTSNMASLNGKPFEFASTIGEHNVIFTIVPAVSHKSEKPSSES